MKLTLLFLCIVLCMLSASISDEEGMDRNRKKCRNPKGYHGSVRTDGCIINTCKNGFWLSSIQSDICCFEREVYQPNTVITTINPDDSCINISVHCKLKENGAKIYFEQSNECGEPATKDQVDDLAMEMSKKMSDISQLIEKLSEGQEGGCPTSTVTFETPVSMTTTSSSSTTITTSETTTATTTTMKMTSSSSTTITTTETTTATNTTTVNPLLEAIMVTGGHHAERSAELFLPSTGKTCDLASLPENKRGHSLDMLYRTPVLCGDKSCFEFTPNSAKGKWTQYATTQVSRNHHSSWVSSKGIILIGGDVADAYETTELVTGAMTFNLTDKTNKACSIYEQDFTIITGGRFTARDVVRYSLKGFIENLPNLLEGRHLHGCGSYNSKTSKILVVAGGYDGSNSLASTETLSSGSSTWTRGESLPRVIQYTASVSLEKSLVFLGGYSGDTRSEIMAYNGTWFEIGRLKMRRSGNAATKMMINASGLLDISGCY